MPQKTRVIDTSGMFQSMIGNQKDPDDLNEPDISISAAEPNRGQNSGRNIDSKRDQDMKHNSEKPKLKEADRQCVKMGCYLTQSNYDALRLHKLVHCMRERSESQIINQALSILLEEEIEILNSINPRLQGDQRIMAALQIALKQSLPRI